MCKQTTVAHLTDPASTPCLYHERHLRLLLARADDKTDDDMGGAAAGR